MNYTLEPTRATRHIVELRYPAWQECKACEGMGDCAVHGIDPYQCGVCNGEGGAWHPMVEFNEIGEPMLAGSYDRDNDTFIPTTKSSILILSGEACEECGGKGLRVAYTQLGLRPCPRCSGTGIEPGTAGEWKVKGEPT